MSVRKSDDFWVIDIDRGNFNGLPEIEKWNHLESYKFFQLN